MKFLSKPLGRRNSEPFQVQVRKFDGRLKGPPRNLIDMGYGVSQALPVITELLREDAPPMFLLQQPEVHLHPSAQAAWEVYSARSPGPERQLIIETHSDHLLDRVRMDIRDGTTGLKPEDVSILYFERGELDVSIHSLRIDEEGTSWARLKVTVGSSWKRYRGLYGSDSNAGEDLNNVRNCRCKRRQRCVWPWSTSGRGKVFGLDQQGKWPAGGWRRIARGTR